MSLCIFHQVLGDVSAHAPTHRLWLWQLLTILLSYLNVQRNKGGKQLQISAIGATQLFLPFENWGKFVQLLWTGGEAVSSTAESHHLLEGTRQVTSVTLPVWLCPPHAMVQPSTDVVPSWRCVPKLLWILLIIICCPSSLSNKLIAIFKGCFRKHCSW